MWLDVNDYIYINYKQLPFLRLVQTSNKLTELEKLRGKIEVKRIKIRTNGAFQKKRKEKEQIELTMQSRSTV